MNPKMRDFLKNIGRLQQQDYVTSDEFFQVFDAIYTAVKDSAVKNKDSIQVIEQVATKKAKDLEKLFIALAEAIDGRMAKVKDGEKGEDGATPVAGVDYPTYKEIRKFIKDSVNDLPKPNDPKTVITVDYIKDSLMALEGNDRLPHTAIGGLENMVEEKVRIAESNLRRSPMYVGGTGQGGAGGTTSPLTTKGDIWGYSTTDARLAVGADGTVLTADATTATGLKWAVPAGGGDVAKVGTPADNQIGVWTGDGTIEGDSALTFNTATDTLYIGGTLELGHASDTTVSRASAGQIAVEGVNVLMNGGALGTPASGTLTNCTGLPLSGVTDSTSEALGVGTLELGHASDTTLSRSSAGVVAVEGVPLATTTITDGKENYHGIQSHGTISFNNTSHVLTIGATTNTYWFQGVKYTTANAITCDLDDYVTLTANTLYFVAFDDATGTLKASATAWGLKTHVPIATVFWNGSAGSVCDETHGHTRDLDWHVWAHTTVGARYGSGLSLTAPTTVADATLTIESGSIWDEDLYTTIAQQTTSRVWYQVSSGVYTFVDSSLPYAGTSGNPQYLDTDTYTLTDTPDNDWVNMWIYATPDIDRPIHIIPTQASTAHGTLASARAAQPPALTGLNLAPEMKLIYKFIYDGDGNFVESVDYRNASVLPAGGTASSTASSVSFVPSGNIASTTVQTAIEELDTEKAAVDQTMYIGTTQVAINRSSAALTLAGITLTTPNIGTPSAGTLTNCSGLPLSGVTDSTSEALGVGTLELGHASDTTLSRVSAGVVAIEGKNILTTDGGTLTGNVTFGENTALILDPALSADGKYCGIVRAGTAGTALAFGDLVYLASADSRWELADADAVGTAGTVLLGICVLAATGDAEPTTILLHGTVRADTAFPTLTIGAPAYVGTTAGDIQVAAPTGADDVVRVVGYALTADELYFNPSPDHITHTG